LNLFLCTQYIEPRFFTNWTVSELLFVSAWPLYLPTVDRVTQWLTLLMVVVGSVKQIVRLGARFWWLLSRRGRKAFIRSGLNSDLVNLHRKAINLFQSNVKRKNVSQKCYIASRWKDFQFYNFADSWDWLYISVISTFHWKFNNLRKFKSKCSASSNWLEL